MLPNRMDMFIHVLADNNGYVHSCRRDRAVNGYECVFAIRKVLPQPLYGQECVFSFWKVLPSKTNSIKRAKSGKTGKNSNVTASIGINTVNIAVYRVVRSLIDCGLGQECAFAIRRKSYLFNDSNHPSTRMHICFLESLTHTHSADQNAYSPFGKSYLRT